MAPRPPLTWAILALCAAAAAISAAPALSEVLRFDRAAIGDGEIWRLATGHLVHFSAPHALRDIGAFALVASLASANSRALLYGALGTGALLVGGGLWAFEPKLGVYGGLSGLTFSLAAALAAGHAFAAGRGRTLARVVLVTMGVWLAYSTLAQPASAGTLVRDGFVPVPLAHTLGALAGVSVAVLRWRAVRGARWQPRPAGPASGVPARPAS